LGAEMLSSSVSWFADLLWPASCRVCGRTGSPEILCEACLGTLVPGSVVSCPCCGRLGSGDPDEPPPHLCGGCLRDPPPWSRARCAFGYGGAIRELITCWKNLPEHRLGPGMCRLMVGAAGAMGWDTLVPETLVVPVPAHPSNLRRRGFHPPALLAGAMGAALGLEMGFQSLTLKRHVPSTRALSRAARLRRTRGAYLATPRVRGRPVLLVDDVITTGATARAAARACRRAGALEVEVAVLARTPDHGDHSKLMVGSAAG
ncbi:MAG: phosphoribosyltransferase family protein, partial [Myxococcota bacterium]|nr:phosphoribosyltransferase family protein [Myxococcota bacterium]